MTCLQQFRRFDQGIRALQPANVAPEAVLHHCADGAGPRMRLVARVRRQIAEGTYDIEAKLDLVLDRLLQLG